MRQVTDLPLHHGKCPNWLFVRMKKLAGEISEIIIDEFGSKELVFRLSNSYWLQALGCVLGFDWHSSGLTTTTMAALKEGLEERNLEVKIAGGKGLNALKTPEEIEKLADDLNLNEKRVKEVIEISKISAKIDNNLVQDGFDLYLHFLTFDKGNVSVVQQGLNEEIKYARRYHWFFELKNDKNFIDEPHKSVLVGKESKNLNLTSKENEKLRNSIVDLINYDLPKIKEFLNKPLFSYFKLPKEHIIKLKHLSKKEINVLKKLEEFEIKDFEDLLKIKGVGKEGIRALALTSNIIYGTPVSWKDFVKYSFAHGGKDGTPYPVNRKTYENTINILEFVIDELKAKGKIKNERKILNKLRKLGHFVDNIYIKD